MAFGLDGIQVHQKEQGWELVNESGRLISVRIVYEDGTDRNVAVKDKVLLN
jgi:hypothetical protein